MKDINTFLREGLPSIFDKIMIAPDIPEKKLNNAIKAFAYTKSPGYIVALFDNTLLGSSKEGLIFTGEQLIYRATFSDPVTINYASITDVKCEKILINKEKNKTEEVVSINHGAENPTSIKNLISCNNEKFVALLNSIVTEFDDYNEAEQQVPISEMSEELKIAYLQIIINMAFDNDDIVDDKELAEILLLTTRLKLNSDTRFQLRTYMTLPEHLKPTEELIVQLNAESPEGQKTSLHVSLVKDLINLFMSTGGKSIDDFAFFQKNKNLFEVSDEQLELILDAIEADHKMLKDDITDDQLKKTLKGLAAKAAAVGTPLAAVYLSGSVIGMSAAGLSSGLAALGMGGALGLSSMATGIGVAVLLGVAAYSGIKKVTGANELDRFKVRELMLDAVIKQTQLTITLLIDDLNFITLKINGCIRNQNEQDEKLKQFTTILKQLTGAGNVLSKKADFAQRGINKSKCAQYLNIKKLKSLTQEPTKAGLYKFIADCYEEREFTLEKDGAKTKIIKLVPKNELMTDQLEALAEAFEAVGYFSASTVVKSATQDILKNIAHGGVRKIKEHLS